jgi:hypothetical protein
MSDPYKRAALTFCNQIRKELGLPRRTKLLKGMSTGYGCPVARTIGAAARYAGPRGVAVPVLGHITYPPNVQQFVYQFDNGKFPELWSPNV